MDTVTQITLGAAVGEAVLGNKAGNKAPLWGAILGVVPDLDILANPFLSEVQEIIAHRGISHSILFCVIASPLFGWLLSKMKWNRDADVEWTTWSWLAFWVISTHILIDVCTSYGTQVFQPFSNYALSFNSIFIIDPFYTLPLLIGIITTLFLKRSSSKRQWANFLGLGISTFYLLLGFGFKWHVNSVFEQNFNQQQISVDRYMTTPAPLTEFLWTGYAESEDRIYAGIYSVFDGNRDIDFTEIPQNKALIEPYRNNLAVQRILWFSNGYYTVQKKKNTLLFSDLRFGRSDLWLTDKQAPYVWNYKLQFNADSTKIIGFEHMEPSFGSNSDQIFYKLINRILGNK